MRFGLPRDNGQPAVGDAGSDEERVSTAALVAAMELLRGMSDHPAATPGDQLLDDIRQAAIGPEELTRRSRRSWMGSCTCSTTQTSTWSLAQ
jgi:hypothetical protein